MYRLIKADFDNATKQRWGATTCLVAQCIMRHGLNVSNMTAWYTILEGNSDSQKEAWRALRIFDKHFRELGDERKPELQALRASLPDSEDVITEVSKPKEVKRKVPDLIPFIPSDLFELKACAYLNQKQ